MCFSKLFIKNCNYYKTCLIDTPLLWTEGVSNHKKRINYRFTGSSHLFSFVQKSYFILSMTTHIETIILKLNPRNFSFANYQSPSFGKWFNYNINVWLSRWKLFLRGYFAIIWGYFLQIFEDIFGLKIFLLWRYFCFSMRLLCFSFEVISL